MVRHCEHCCWIFSHNVCCHTCYVLVQCVQSQNLSNILRRPLHIRWSKIQHFSHYRSKFSYWFQCIWSWGPSLSQHFLFNDLCIQLCLPQCHSRSCLPLPWTVSCYFGQLIIFAGWMPIYVYLCICFFFCLYSILYIWVSNSVFLRCYNVLLVQLASHQNCHKILKGSFLWFLGLL